MCQSELGPCTVHTPANCNTSPNGRIYTMNRHPYSRSGKYNAKTSLGCVCLIDSTIPSSLLLMSEYVLARSTPSKRQYKVDWLIPTISAIFVHINHNPRRYSISSTLTFTIGCPGNLHVGKKSTEVQRYWSNSHLLRSNHILWQVAS